MAIRYAPQRPEPAQSAKPIVKAEAGFPAAKRKPGGGRKPSSDPKEIVTLRLPRSEIARWKAMGPDWRARMAAALTPPARKPDTPPS